MATPSGIINKLLRKHVSPVLRTAGFEKIDARNGWAWKPDVILVFNIRAVGRHFGEVAGWPPSSVCVWLGAHFRFMPPPPRIKIDPMGRMLPTEYQCHMRSRVIRKLEQDDRTQTLRNPPEKKRRDIWWLDSDGGNAEDVVRDITEGVQSQALPWFTNCLDLDAVFHSIEAEHDCLNKYVRAAYVAKRLGRVDAHKRFVDLAENEAKRIGRIPDAQTWFSAYGRPR